MNRATQYIQDHQAEVNPHYYPRYHLAPPLGWMNDPNGFVYYQGAYHLFYQHYPYGSQWGPMHWGHATSKDLVNWQHQPVALEPIEEYEADGCFSGSAIEREGRLYLMYTGHYERDGQKRETQCIAISEDGRHFEKYAGNPVIDGSQLAGIADSADFRDPKVFERQGRYYCVVASKTADDRGQILLFSSSDLLAWEFVSVLLEGTDTQGIMWECPDLFELDGKDVLIMSPIQIPKKGYQYDNTSSTVAFIGKVDWLRGRFSVEAEHEIDFGLDFYAPQTCLNQKDQRIMVAWMQMWDRTMPTHDLNHGWVGAMTLPRRLRVRDNQLIQEPITAITAYLEPVLRREDLLLNQQQLIERIPQTSQINVTIAPGKAQRVVIRIGQQEEHLSLVYQTETAELTLNRSISGYDIIGSEASPLRQRTAKVPLVKGMLALEIYVDKSSIEVFADQTTMTSTFYPKSDARQLMIEAEGESQLKTLVVNRIKGGGR